MFRLLMMQERVPPSFGGTAPVEARQADQHALGVVLLLSTTRLTISEAGHSPDRRSRVCTPH
jgi:hypothetical protein